MFCSLLKGVSKLLGLGGNKPLLCDLICFPSVRGEQWFLNAQYVVDFILLPSAAKPFLVEGFGTPSLTPFFFVQDANKSLNIGSYSWVGVTPYNTPLKNSAYLASPFCWTNVLHNPVIMTQELWYHLDLQLEDGWAKNEWSSKNPYANGVLDIVVISNECDESHPDRRSTNKSNDHDYTPENWLDRQNHWRKSDSAKYGNSFVKNSSNFWGVSWVELQRLGSETSSTYATYATVFFQVSSE